MLVQSALKLVEAGRTVVPTTVHSVNQQIESFLEMPLPIGFSVEEEAVRLLESTDMEELMLERAPFFFVEKAVSVGDKMVLGKVRMTKERSAGHFPGRPIIPLIELCRAMAQTGVILASLHGSSEEAPIAFGSGESKALAKHLISAPADVLIKVVLVQRRFNLFWINGSAFIDGVEIGSLNKISYTLVNRTQIQNGTV